MKCLFFWRYCWLLLLCASVFSGHVGAAPSSRHPVPSSTGYSFGRKSSDHLTETLKPSSRMGGCTPSAKGVVGRVVEEVIKSVREPHSDRKPLVAFAPTLRSSARSSLVPDLNVDEQILLSPQKHMDRAFDLQLKILKAKLDGVDGAADHFVSQVVKRTPWSANTSYFYSYLEQFKPDPGVLRRIRDALARKIRAAASTEGEPFWTELTTYQDLIRYMDEPDVAEVMTYLPLAQRREEVWLEKQSRHESYSVLAQMKFLEHYEQILHGRYPEKETLEKTRAAYAALSKKLYAVASKKAPSPSYDDFWSTAANAAQRSGHPVEQLLGEEAEEVLFKITHAGRIRAALLRQKEALSNALNEMEISGMTQTIQSRVRRLHQDLSRLEGANQKISKTDRRRVSMLLHPTEADVLEKNKYLDLRTKGAEYLLRVGDVELKERFFPIEFITDPDLPMLFQVRLTEVLNTAEAQERSDALAGLMGDAHWIKKVDLKYSEHEKTLTVRFTRSDAHGEAQIAKELIQALLQSQALLIVR